ncbi:MAG: class I SAM-dependent methyltransferase [Planctomycetota bacterium]
MPEVRAVLLGPRVRPGDLRGSGEGAGLGAPRRYRRRVPAVALAAGARLGARPEGGGSILDFGCGTGDFVAVADQSGFWAVGYEPSISMRAIARRNVDEGYSIDQRRIRSQLPLGKGDAITLWDVIEHLPAPARTLQDLVGRLEPGGIVGVVTPDVTAAGDDRVGWRHYKPREHLDE